MRVEFTGAVMMRGHDRVASRFTPDTVLRMPGLPVGPGRLGGDSRPGRAVPPTAISITRLRQVACTERMNSLTAHGDAPAKYVL